MSDVQKEVREFYGKIGSGEETFCCAPTCCAPSAAPQEEQIAIAIGYSDELKDLPEGANLGLGCGNPTAIAALKAGEVVVDLGSGGGIDCFLASKRVGSTGRVIGIDMTASMIERARNNAKKGDFQNVEFRLGEIEHLPIADNTADVVISNCVINLSDQKQQVWSEAFRVLKPGGRVAISDVLAEKELPPDVIKNILAVVSCVAGAATLQDQVEMLTAAGFVDIQVQTKPESKNFIREWVPGSRLEEYVVSATIEATKP